MRCLYCGKELALLKRWTGGGEFCSEAHRQRYQEEYNQLALNRLLQAKPPNESSNAAKPEGQAQPTDPRLERPVERPPVERPMERRPEPPAPTLSPSVLRPAEARSQPAYQDTAPPASRRIEAPVVSIPEEESRPVYRNEPAYVAAPAPKPVVEEPAPAEAAGFFIELPVPVFAEVASMAQSGVELLSSAAASLPRYDFQPWDAQQLATAGHIVFEPSNRVLNYTNGSREPRLEVREFVRTNPVVEFAMAPAGKTGLDETSDEAMDILIFPRPPQGPPPLWQESAASFAAVTTELGGFARLTFVTTGIEDKEENQGAEGQPPIQQIQEEPAAEPARSAVDAFLNRADFKSAPRTVNAFPPAAATPANLPPTPPPSAPKEADRVVTKSAPPQIRVPEPMAKAIPKPVTVQPPPQRVVEPPAKQVVSPAVSIAPTAPVTQVVPKQVVPETQAAPPPKPAAPKEPPPPAPATKPLPIVLHGVAAGKAKPVQIFPSAAALSAVDVQIPRSTALPLRPVMVFGPAPAPTTPAPVPSKPATSTVLAPPVKPAEKAPEKTIEKKPPERTVVVKAEPRKPSISLPPRPEPKQEPRTDVKPPDAKLPNGKPRVPEVRVSPPAPKEPEPPKSPVVPRPEVKETERKLVSPAAAAATVKEPPKPAPKEEVKPAAVQVQPAKQTQQVKQVQPVKSNPPGKESSREEKQTPKEDAKPKQDTKPMPKDIPLPTPLAAPYPGTDLGLPKLNLESQGFWAKLPMVAKIGIAVVLLAAVGGVIALTSKNGGAATVNGGTVETLPAITAGDGGWITDWGADPGVRRTRNISVLRASQTLTDYRIELEGQIETKAIGWIYRAADPKNFYVTKLEIVKPGLEPAVALVRFAVLNGEEQPRAQFPLSLKVRRDTMYHIRFDAIGNKFATWVQDEKVDEFTDDHIKTGGMGLYSERGEVATLKGSVSVVPLVIRK